MICRSVEEDSLLQRWGHTAVVVKRSSPSSARVVVFGGYNGRARLGDVVVVDVDCAQLKISSRRTQQQQQQQQQGPCVRMPPAVPRT